MSWYYDPLGVQTQKQNTVKMDVGFFESSRPLEKKITLLCSHCEPGQRGLPQIDPTLSGQILSDFSSWSINHCRSETPIRWFQTRRTPLFHQTIHVAEVHDRDITPCHRSFGRLGQSKTPLLGVTVSPISGVTHDFCVFQKLLDANFSRKKNISKVSQSFRPWICKKRSWFSTHWSKRIQTDPSKGWTVTSEQRDKDPTYARGDPKISIHWIWSNHGYNGWKFLLLMGRTPKQPLFGCKKPCKIMGYLRRINWFAGFLPSTVSTGHSEFACGTIFFHGWMRSTVVIQCMTIPPSCNSTNSDVSHLLRFKWDGHLWKSYLKLFPPKNLLGCHPQKKCVLCYKSFNISIIKGYQLRNLGGG